MTLHIKLSGVEFDAGSFGEAIAIVENDPKSADFFALVAKINAESFGIATVAVDGSASASAPSFGIGSVSASAPVDPSAATLPARRGRRSKAEIAAAEAAAAAAAAQPTPAPPPLPVAPPMPVVPPATPVPNPGTGQDGMGVPDFLKRTADPVPNVAASNTDAPPPAPIPPPVAPPAPTPPVLVLGPKIADRLAASKPGPADSASWLTYLFNLGVIPNAEKTTFDEAVAVVRHTADEKLQAVASHLGVV
jgi:hypothetical protein